MTGLMSNLELGVFMSANTSLNFSSDMSVSDTLPPVSILSKTTSNPEPSGFFPGRKSNME
jgi:hypothetical protein